MGDDNTQLAALLLNMQENIRDDIKDCKTDLSARIEDVRAKQGEHDLRLTSLEKQTSGIGLTKAQKTALWTALSGLALEAVRHLGGWLTAAAASLLRGVSKL